MHNKILKNILNLILKCSSWSSLSNVAFQLALYISFATSTFINPLHVPKSPQCISILVTVSFFQLYCWRIAVFLTYKRVISKCSAVSYISWWKIQQNACVFHGLQCFWIWRFNHDDWNCTHSKCHYMDPNHQPPYCKSTIHPFEDLCGWETCTSVFMVWKRGLDSRLWGSAFDRVNLTKLAFLYCLGPRFKVQVH